MKYLCLWFISFFPLTSLASIGDGNPNLNDDVDSCVSAPASAALTGNIHFQRDAPVGTESDFVTPAAVATMNCLLIENESSDRDVYYQFMVPSGGVSGFSGVFPTNLEGVGIKYYYQVTGYSGFQNCDFEDNERWVRDNSTYIGVKCHWMNGTPTSSVEVALKAKLVKTSHPIASGVLTESPTSINSRVAYNWTGFVKALSDITLSYAINVSTDKCTLATPALLFKFGNISIDDFSGSAGYSPDKTASQNLTLDCDPNANINITLVGAQNPDTSDATVLALTGQGEDGVAKGIGVQLLYEGNPLELNNLLNLKRSSGGKEDFTISARYFQTKDKALIRPGTANSTAVLDITYQ